jgi:hypothetical protein
VVLKRARSHQHTKGTRIGLVEQQRLAQRIGDPCPGPKADRDLVAVFKPNSIALRIAMVAADEADLVATCHQIAVGLGQRIDRHTRAGHLVTIARAQRAAVTGAMSGTSPPPR